MLRIQYASNLLVHTHSFQNSSRLLKPVAPILALLGNIGLPNCNRTKEFMTWADMNYDRILWIPGALEYSSPAYEAMTWNERGDQIYKSIHTWGLKHTHFCQKLEFIYPGTDIHIIATSLGFPIGYLNQHYVSNSRGIHERMKQLDAAHFMKDEFEWLHQRLTKIYAPTIILSNQYVPNGFVRSGHIYCNIHGVYGTTPVSYTGDKDPWRAINMAGHSDYLPNLYFTFEIHKNKDKNMR